MKKQILITLTFLLCLVGAHSQGTITNIRVSQGADTDLRLVDILFNLTGSDAAYDITLEASFDDGANYEAIDNANVSGDITVAPGLDINLVWDGRVNNSTQSANFSRIRITATTALPFNCGDDLLDARDSKSYSTVLIGTQCWMAENLNYDQSAYGGDWCYDDTPANCDTYGRLYDWDAVMQGATTSNSNPSGVQGVCPEGWHVPSDAEWTELVSYVASNGHSGAEGTALKSTSGWNSGGNGTDNFGFSALPGGYRYSNGTFNYIGNYGIWWSATEYGTNSAWDRYLDYNYSSVDRLDDYKEVGFSVRCLRD